MLAGRRARQRPLIRSTTMTTLWTRGLTASDGMVKRSQQQKNAWQDGPAAFPHQPSSELSSIQSLSHQMPSMPQPGSIKYIQQLSSLHAAGILTDEEVQAAKRRLLGS